MDYRELRDLSISAVALALMFAIAWYEGKDILFVLALSATAVPTAFLLHELSHRFAARRFGCHSEYHMWPDGIKIALFVLIATKLLGFPILFAAPGAVVIFPRVSLWGHTQKNTKREDGLISLAGPAVNLLLSAACFGLMYATPADTILYALLGYAVQINVFLALFNLLPVPPLDGSKVLGWNKLAWAAFFLGALGLYIFL